MASLEDKSLLAHPASHAGTAVITGDSVTRTALSATPRVSMTEIGGERRPDAGRQKTGCDGNRGE